MSLHEPAYSPATRTMRALARLALEDRGGDLGNAAAIALAKVVLEECPAPDSLTGAGLARRLLEGTQGNVTLQSRAKSTHREES